MARPDTAAIEDFLAAASSMEISYNEICLTKHGLPHGYSMDEYRTHLGAGAETFARASEALRAWEMFKLGWVEIFPAGAPIAVGENVAVLIRHLGFYSLNAARIVYVIDEERDGVRRFGFAYGTLTDHGESGEERFLIEWDRRDHSVSYDIRAISRPRALLARLAYPVTRTLQKRFGRDSLRAMSRCCAAPTGLNHLASPTQH